MTGAWGTVGQPQRTIARRSRSAAQAGSLTTEYPANGSSLTRTTNSKTHAVFRKEGNRMQSLTGATPLGIGFEHTCGQATKGVR
jgi:hypothetical protein